jgi:hypothetical protein
MSTLPSNPMHGTTAIGIQCHTQDYIVAIHVADFQRAKEIRDYLSSLVTTSVETSEPLPLNERSDLIRLLRQRYADMGDTLARKAADALEHRRSTSPTEPT